MFLLENDRDVSTYLRGRCVIIFSHTFKKESLDCRINDASVQHIISFGALSDVSVITDEDHETWSCLETRFKCLGLLSVSRFKFLSSSLGLVLVSVDKISILVSVDQVSILVFPSLLGYSLIPYFPFNTEIV